MSTKRLPSAAKQSRSHVSGLAMTIAAALGTLAMPAFSADTKSAAKEETLTVVGSSQSQQENAWGPVGTYAAKHSATGTKTDTPIEKTPQSVSVVTREEMDMRQPDTVKGALAYTPGVMVGNRGASTAYDAVNIRGFSSVGTNMYLDGLKLQDDNYSIYQIDPYFLERAEVLRGPSSVLYGKSNPGGVVALVSKRPTTETLREVQFKMGTDNLFQTGFDFGGALDDDGIYSYRLTGLARDEDQQQVGEKSKRYAIAPSFSWRPDDRTSLTFLSSFQDDPSVGFYGWLPKEGTVQNGINGKLPTSFNDGEPGYNNISRKQQMVGYAFEHGFDDVWTLRQNLRYSKMDVDYRSIYGQGISATNPAELTRGVMNSKEHLSSFAVDTQAQAKFATAAVDHTLLMGVDYMRMRNDVVYQYGSASSLNVVAPQYGNQSYTITGDASQVNRQEQTGLYVQDQAEWNNWVLTMGGRYDWSDTNSTNRLKQNLVSKQKDNEFTGRAGLNYVFENGIAPYVSYSESFEPTSGTDFSGNTFAASKGKQYEAGVKFAPKDRPITASIAIYQLTKTNNKVADPDHVFASIQGGEIRSRGVELEGKAALTANVNLLGSYTYTDAEYTKDTTQQGNTPAAIPKHMASVWADYTFHETALSGLTLGSGVRYVGSSYGDEANTFKVKDYTVVDAAIKYDLARFNLPGSSIGINVNNLFDKEYVSSCFATYGCYWGAERQVVATATFRF
ncbi:ferrichrome porin FhuA [Serratia liquefaciens]|jgi:iron complex outermembrane receptor protein|uniref:Ferrichrome porin FhuA n=1 Tax=Serratia liquefaciens TaxID=614 RepID=A0ABX7D5K2_SERLI|nr:ferrichrome porin FhuA [Serratia liquefaciens]MDU3933626.1 ferrichrome porin FhuA [Serratia liquefaciens]QQU56030.1 ferrichrome porin FhuA [Serratia liquefaciens]RYM82206.1 ferrichrome porin FhuA [Serratia liquefaciens]SUI42476.1 Ferric hydroxamate uptake [Serratia liquefaciens]HCT9094931.1 ferrichrome porin FhuA [Serratia liquefaciens]